MNNDFNKYKRRDYSQLRKDYDSLRRISTDSLDVTPEQLNDPVFGDYYKQYVDTINKLKERENSLLRNAAVAQDTAIANAEENVATLTAENERRAGELRQGREELESLARQRARAMGGMPGSAYEEIQARSERELLKTLANMSTDYNNKLVSIERDLVNRINALESDLMDKLAQIEADKTMTLRERDKAINQLKLEMMRRAEEEARAAQARAAAERARLADMAFYNDLVQQSQQQAQQQGSVKGPTTQSTQPQERYSVTIGADQESATGGAASGSKLNAPTPMDVQRGWASAVNNVAGIPGGITGALKRIGLSDDEIQRLKNTELYKQLNSPAGWLYGTGPGTLTMLNPIWAMVNPATREFGMTAADIAAKKLANNAQTALSKANDTANNWYNSMVNAILNLYKT